MKIKINGWQPASALRRLVLLSVFFSFFFSSLGCDAFVRKFTRKKKKTEPHEEMVLTPQEYKCTLSKDELYRQHLLYWKSWQDELIEALNQNISQKKKVSCVNEAIKNLMQMRGLLNAEKQKQLNGYIDQMQQLRDSIESDSYGSDSANNRCRAEQLRMYILRGFSYNKVKDSLI